MCSRCVASVLFGTQCFVFSSFVDMSMTMQWNAVKQVSSMPSWYHFLFHVPEMCGFMLFGTNVFPFWFRIELRFFHARMRCVNLGWSYAGRFWPADIFESGPWKFGDAEFSYPWSMLFPCCLEHMFFFGGMDAMIEVALGWWFLSCEGPCEFGATVCWELQNVIISIERTVGPIL